jgi:SAM-dependent methyltransferase
MCEEHHDSAKLQAVPLGPSEHDVSRKVREFYEKFRFPTVRPPAQDGLILMRRLDRSVGRSRNNASTMRVLDAGCGTGNTVISLAKQFTDIEFLGTDFSAPSLSIAEQAARVAGLQNIRFRTWDLMEPERKHGAFDIVLCLGVLHHTANMERVLSNLRGVLKDEGELYLWLYGRHGRYRHFLNRRVLGMLLDPESDSDEQVRLAREFALHGGNGAVLNDLFGTRAARSMQGKVLEEPAWVADQFLNPHEVLLDMEELLALASTAGLEIDQWLGAPEKVSCYLGSPEVAKRFEQLPRHQRFIALDLLLKPDRYFVTLRKSPNRRGDTP